MSKPTALGARRDLLVVQDAPSRWEKGAMAIYEFDALTRDGRQTRRIQRMRMIRGDRVVDYDRDLGSASEFDCGPICVIGALDRSDTVGELQDEAETLRGETRLKQLLAEKREQSTLIRDITNQIQMTAEYQRRNPVSTSHFTR